MSNEHKPLLSERQLIDKFRVKPDEAPDGYEHGIAAVNTAIYVRDIYEAERAKDRELIQKLVDALGQKGESLGASQPHLSNYIAYTGGYWKEKADALKLAADRGITPTEP